MPISVQDIQLLAREELRRRSSRQASQEAIETDWEGWLRQMFPAHVTHPFARHHRKLWRWLWRIEAGKRPRSFVGIWSRGGGKSSTAEMGVVALGARNRRKYVVYVAGSQEQADTRVANVSALLESDAVTSHYPKLGRRQVAKYGRARGWRRNRLWTAHGFIVDALGLDVAAVRGLKLEDQRPDFIVLDDIDARHDTPLITQKKVDTITQTVLPIGSDTAGVLAVQNLILPHGVFSRLATGKADFLADRIMSGPVPAVRNLKTEPIEQDNGVIRQVIVGGVPSWAGQDLDECQQLIDLVGLRAFLREQNHQVQDVEGALWKSSDIRHIEELPGELMRVVVGVDPSGGRAEIGIVVAGLLSSGQAVVLVDNTQPGHLGPPNWARASLDAYAEWEADVVAAESNFGGDMVEHTLTTAAREDEAVAVVLVNASRGKAVRAEPVVQQYDNGKVVHLGYHQDLESEMTQWVKGTGPSPNRLDALVWALTELFWPKNRKTRAVWGQG